MNIKRVGVFCGSSAGNNPVFTEETRKLGSALANQNIGLVFGGGSVGLMNEIANSVLESNGEVQGVIPQHLLDREVGHQNLTELHVTKTMHERKALISKLSDAFIALPGGFGTLEEIMEIITWAQIDIQVKKTILFNMDGYYDGLINFIDHAIESGFIKKSNRKLLNIVATTDECMQCLNSNQ